MSHSKKPNKTKPTRSPSPKATKTKEGEAVSGIEVQATRNVTRECTKALRNIIDNSNLNFREEEFLRERWVKCRLVGEGARIAVTDKETYSVLPVLQARSVLYWLGILLEFRFIPKDIYRLTNASLILFKGEANEPRKIPLLRAEWDWREQEGSFTHAQPHWHLYRSEVSEIDAQQETWHEEGSGLDEIATINEDEWTKAADFHFAMASTWHLDAANSPQIQINNPQNFVNWMSGCIAYTIGQLRFLHK